MLAPQWGGLPFVGRRPVIKPSDFLGTVYRSQNPGVCEAFWRDGMMKEDLTHCFAALCGCLGPLGARGEPLSLLRTPAPSPEVSAERHALRMAQCFFAAQRLQRAEIPWRALGLVFVAKASFAHLRRFSTRFRRI